VLNYLWKKSTVRVLAPKLCGTSHHPPQKKPEEGFCCPAGPSIVETPPQENMKPLKS